MISHRTAKPTLLKLGLHRNIISETPDLHIVRDGHFLNNSEISDFRIHMHHTEYVRQESVGARNATACMFLL